MWREAVGLYLSGVQSRMCTTKNDTLNTGGRCLLEALNQTDMIISTGRGRGDIGQPTCKSVTRTEHFVMTTHLFGIFDRVETPSYPSNEFDHSPIQIFFSPTNGVLGGGARMGPKHICDSNCRTEWQLQWKGEKRQSYAQAIENSTELISKFNSSVDEGNVDGAAGLLMDIIHGAAKHASVGMVRSLKCAHLRREQNGKRVRFPEWFDHGCREARWKLKQALFSGEAMHLYRARKREYRQLLRRAQRQHTKHLQALFLDRLERMDVDALKMLRKKTPRKASPIATSAWRDYIAKHFSATEVTPDALPPNHPDPVRGAGEGRGAGNNFAFELPDEGRVCALVTKYARRLKVDTAAGFDGLLAPFVKHAVFKWGPKPEEQRHVLAPLLGKLFHCMLSRGVAPSAWKVARLSPIHKKDDVCVPDNYRMIAVNGVLYRVYANVVRELLTKWSVATGAVPDTQFAFYLGRNAQQAMFIMRHLIHSTRNRGGERGKNLFASFVDFTQAYDHIDRERMWAHFKDKLHMPIALLEAVRGLYTGDAYVLCDGTDKQTEAIHPTKGVKQGCPLSPLLFALYVSDIKEVFAGCVEDGSKGGVQISLEDVGERMRRLVSHLLYADDLVLFATNERAMQSMLDSLKAYADRKGLTVNATKTQVVVFNGRPWSGQLKYGGRALAVVEKFKYLGMWFSRETKKVRNMLKLAAGAWCAPMMGGMLNIHKTAQHVGVHHMPHAMLRLFQTFVVPYGMYACQIWGTQYIHPDDVYKSDIQIRHLGFLRRLLGVKRSVSNDVVMSESCQTPFQFYWLRSTCRFWNEVCEANSDLLRDVAKADVLLSRDCDRCWSAQLADALEAYPGLEGHAAECLGNLSKIDVGRVVAAWRNHYDRRWQVAIGDPRDPDLPNRKLCTYNAYFRREGGGSWWHLPAHLKAGALLSPEVVRSVTRFRLSSHNLEVEIGRYRHGHRMWQDRVCRRCIALGVQQPQVDDESHMVLECAHFQEVRENNAFADLFEGAAGRDLRQFMCNKNSVGVAQFIHQCMECVDHWDDRVEDTQADQP